MCGMGRTGRWFACEHFGLVPDILVLGKGLNAGALPLSAVLARRPVLDTLARGSGAFHHAQTYSHHPAACAAGLATMRILARERLVERVALMEPTLRFELERLRGHAAVGDVRGRGFLFAIEFVADRESRRPFDRSARFAERFAERAFANGLVVWPNAGSIGGRDGDLAIVAPPFNVTEEEIADPRPPALRKPRGDDMSASRRITYTSTAADPEFRAPVRRGARRGARATFRSASEARSARDRSKATRRIRFCRRSIAGFASPRSPWRRPNDVESAIGFARGGAARLASAVRGSGGSSFCAPRPSGSRRATSSSPPDGLRGGEDPARGDGRGRGVGRPPALLRRADDGERRLPPRAGADEPDGVDRERPPAVRRVGGDRAVQLPFGARRRHDRRRAGDRQHGRLQAGARRADLGRAPGRRHGRGRSAARRAAARPRRRRCGRCSGRRPARRRRRLHRLVGGRHGAFARRDPGCPPPRRRRDGREKPGDRHRDGRPRRRGRGRRAFGVRLRRPEVQRLLTGLRRTRGGGAVTRLLVERAKECTSAIRRSATRRSVR